MLEGLVDPAVNPGLRVLLQPAPVREGSVQALPGEQAAGQLQPHRLPGANLYQAEIRLFAPERQRPRIIRAIDDAPRLRFPVRSGGHKW